MQLICGEKFSKKLGRNKISWEDENEKFHKCQNMEIWDGEKEMWNVVEKDLHEHGKYLPRITSIRSWHSWWGKGSKQICIVHTTATTGNHRFNVCNKIFMTMGLHGLSSTLLLSFSLSLTAFLSSFTQKKFMMWKFLYVNVAHESW